jgi:PAS domain S-box-containing protein
MSLDVFDSTILPDAAATVDFITNILQASTEYSVIGTSLDGTILLWNTGTRRIYGYEPEEVVGRANASILQVPEDIEAGVPLYILDSALKFGKWEGTIELVRKNGQRFNARVVITPRLGTGGAPIGFLFISRDLGEELRLNEDLKATQSYARSLFESNTDALTTTDPLGIITDANRQMELLTGRARDELVDTAFKDCFTDPRRAEEGLKQVLREGRITNYELTARNKDGSETAISYNAATFKDARGKLHGVFAAARDITGQKQLEEQLRVSHAYNRGLIETSVDGLITVDPFGIISDVNARMCQMGGYQREQVIGTSFAEYFVDPDRVAAVINETLTNGAVIDYVLTMAMRDGQHLSVLLNASVFKDKDDRVSGIFASARDITDQVRLQTQLRDEHAYNRGLIEASLDGLITVDAVLNITDVNDAMCRMTGYARSDLIGSKFPKYFTDQKRAAAGVRLTFHEHSVTNYELVLLHRTGHKITVSFNASVFRGQDGMIQGIFASARDISEQARLQSQLNEHQAYNRSLVEASADALFVIQPDGDVIDVNVAATRLTGYSRKHLVNTAFAEYFTDPVRARAGVRQAMVQKRVLDYELTLIARQGGHIAVNFNAGVFSDGSGQPRGVLVAARDITRQKTLEQQLRDQQFYTRSLIESNIDALMTTDPVGNITDVNQQMELLTGHRRDDLIGTPFKNCFTVPRRAEDAIRRVLREGKVTDFELTARAESGAETVVSYNATTLYDRDGKLQGVFAAARDMTDHKRFEQALQEKNFELEKADRSKDRFLAGMSHELRTPLNAILGFTGTILMKLAGPLTVDQEKQLKTVQTSGRHLLSLIDDLLDLAKIEAGKVELKLEAVSCGTLLEEVAASMRPLAEAKKLRFALDLPKNEVSLRTDRRSLSQIVINLLANAIKFTETGAVVLKLQRPRRKGRAVTTICVTDTGIGIAPAEQSKLFQAFIQLDSGSTRRHDGTGLGLHLSSKLAQLIGGKISVKSQVGKGSAFTVTIPDRLQ